MTSSVLVALRVKVPAQRAFEAFTGEIDQWWRPSQLFQLTPRGDGVLSFEPGAQGRLITTLPNGVVFEVGRITAWVPGERLAFTWRMGTFAPEQVTHVEVLFEAVGENETRVSVEHRGWDAIPQEHLARHNFPERVFLMRQAEHWRTLLAAFAGQVTKAG